MKGAKRVTWTVVYSQACPLCCPENFDGSQVQTPKVEFCVDHARHVLAALAFGIGSGPARRERGIAPLKHSRRGRAGSVERRTA